MIKGVTHLAHIIHLCANDSYEDIIIVLNYILTLTINVTQIYSSRLKKILLEENTTKIVFIENNLRCFQYCTLVKKLHNNACLCYQDIFIFKLYNQGATIKSDSNNIIILAHSSQSVVQNLAVICC